MKKGSVLLADNHQEMLEGIRGLLETMFESVVMVADEVSLIQSIDKLSPDMVVVDLSFPVSKEVNIAKRLKTHNHDLKIIILSVHDDKTVEEKIMETGVDAYVLKRSAATDLIMAVEEIRQGGVFISPGLRV
jgi:DNA-binding NarL/FixJ family response regulator